ncbi:MAG: PQQ-dependent sugar dehydrogenase [Pseudomonadota bacterium]
MHWLLKGFLIVLALAGVIAAGATWYLATSEQREPSRQAYLAHCAQCHGTQLEGSALGPSLAAPKLSQGQSTAELIASVQQHQSPAAAAWETAYSPTMSKALALYVSEQRQGIPTISASHHYQIPTGLVRTQHHNFTVELVADLQQGPYAMAPLPDGRVLISEKVRGLSIVELDGRQGPLLEGTPRVWSEIVQVRGSFVGLGMMLDVQLHPDFAQNGWIYLSHSDRCQLSCGSAWPVSMVRVLRGRIHNNQWVDSEIIWSVHKDNYTVVPDGVAAGRLALDGQGFVYVTVGGKSTYDNLHVMDTPYGKVHRVAEDGTVPQDNPFWLPANQRSVASTRHTVYSYGHRTTQGLTAHPRTGAIWATEMGPRGGDEINLIQAGGNYGWPLYTEGLDYNAEPISIGTDLGLDFARSVTIAPVVDFTPAPSLSNFTFHDGDQFTHWQDDMLVGSLRAQTLYRIRLQDGVPVEQEKLITGLGRIRDVEMGFDGLVYVLLEHGESGSLVRLVPD